MNGLCMMKAVGSWRMSRKLEAMARRILEMSKSDRARLLRLRKTGTQKVPRALKRLGKEGS
jgi:hypothetical protein